MISEDRIKELKKSFPVGEPLALINNRDLIINLITIKRVFAEYHATFSEKLAELLKPKMVMQGDIDDDDHITVEDELEDFSDSLNELRDDTGLDFDNLPGCPAPLIGLIQQFETPDDVSDFLDIMIDWLIHVDLNITSEEYAMLNIGISSKGFPIVTGYDPAMF